MERGGRLGSRDAARPNWQDGARPAYDGVHEEVAAVVDCLSRAGLVQWADFHASLHRRRFEAARRASPCSWDLSLPDVLVSEGVAGDVCRRFFGRRELRAVRAASSSLRPMMQGALADPERSQRWLFLAGGFDREGCSLRECECLDLLDPRGAWEPLPPMAERRGGAALVPLRSQLYCLGGLSNSGLPLNTVECLDPLARRWHPAPHMMQCRAGVCGGALGQVLVVAGGSRENWDTLRSAERFRAETGRWQPVPPMRVRRWCASAAVCNESLLVAGGLSDAAGGGALASGERFDLLSECWEDLPDMLRPRGWPAMVAVADSVYVFGGVTSGSTLLACGERHRCGGDGGWEELPRMASEKQGAGAAVLGEHVYVCGGRDVDGGPLRSCERFDPASRTWEALPETLDGRSALSAAGLEWRE